jgi:hypothetical protein
MREANEALAKHMSRVVTFYEHFDSNNTTLCHEEERDATINRMTTFKIMHYPGLFSEVKLATTTPCGRSYISSLPVCPSLNTKPLA